MSWCSVGIWLKALLSVVLDREDSLLHSSRHDKLHVAATGQPPLVPPECVTQRQGYGYPLDKQEARATHPVRNRFPQLFIHVFDVSRLRIFYMYWISPSATTLVNRGRHYYVGIIKLLTRLSKSCTAELTESDVGFLWSQMWIHQFASLLQHLWPKKK